MTAAGATRLAFFLTGFATAAWAPLVPYAQARTGLGEGGLGLLLLGLGAGAICAMPVAGAVAARLGCRAVILAAGLVAAALLPSLAVLAALPWLLLALFGFGAALGMLDVAMNLQAIVVEQAADRPMMSGFHGQYSLGGIAGAGGMAGLLWLGASPLVGTLVVSVLVLAALAAAVPGLLPREGGVAPGPVFALPRSGVLLIGLLVFGLFLVEGAMLDWSAVFLTSLRGLDPALAGLGFAAFAAAMTIGRLTGDQVVRRLGGGLVLLAGPLVGAAGLALAVLAPGWPVAVLGFALVGLGCANAVPVLFSAAGRQPDVPTPVAVPATMTLGYGGLLLGPAAIGGVAQAAGLAVAFGLLALLLVVVAAGSRRLRG